jgi:valyl-tRNA synthetase
MDEKRSESVIKVFCDLYEKGKIYRGVRMVNWDPQALTALSDEEVIYKEQQGKMYYLRYRIVGENAFAVVATTRPETIMGDTAMCINPNDPKTAHLKGKRVIVPLINREIPVIEDEYVDMEFGTGCLKVTPAHDVNDYMLGEKYNLPSIDIFNDNGTLNENGAQYAGMDRFDCRKQIENDLQEAGLLEKVEQYTNKVGFSERTHVAIEPKLSMQWFLKMEELAKPALENVENDTIKFYPEKFKNTYRHWMTNIKDWCISRQLWWGHQIPAYYLPQGGFVVGATKEAAYQKALSVVNYPLSIEELRQDEDCLDTWFSSWLWPISVFDGINNPDNDEINYYYPTNDLVTGPDIIFFWVARMIMSGYEYRHKECFSNVYFTGIVRDKLGRKMSKQLGNSPEPLELIEKYGADGVRMGMMLAAPAGNDIHFDEALCEQGRNFSSKIWNAFRLVQGWNVDNTIAQPEYAKAGIAAMREKINEAALQIKEQFEHYRISEALMTVYKLFWDEFSAWYLEIAKPEYGTPIDAQTYATTIAFFDEILKLLHPFMPFITEEIWHYLAVRNEGESIMVQQVPVYTTFDAELLKQYDEVKDIIAGIRGVRKDKNIAFKETIQLYIKGLDCEKAFAFVLMKKLANISEISLTNEDVADAVSFRVGAVEYFIPLAQKINIEEEREKIQAELTYIQGFLQSVEKKLSNERFVTSAPAAVVEGERKKQADALGKIEVLKKRLKSL